MNYTSLVDSVCPYPFPDRDLQPFQTTHLRQLRSILCETGDLSTYLTNELKCLDPFDHLQSFLALQQYTFEDKSHRTNRQGKAMFAYWRAARVRMIGFIREVPSSFGYVMLISDADRDHMLLSQVDHLSWGGIRSQY